MSSSIGAPAFDPRDVQAELLSGSHEYAAVRYFFIQVNADTFPSWLGELLSGGHVKHLTVDEDRPSGEAERWHVNVGFTHAGLDALGYRYQPRPDALQNRSAEARDAFAQGMAVRQGADWTGDTTLSEPTPWSWGPAPDDQLHAMVWLAGIDPADVHFATTQLFGLTGSAVDLVGEDFVGGRVLRAVDAGMLDGFSHFGFLDGVSNPDIEEVRSAGDEDDTNVRGGGLYSGMADVWNPVRLGEFLLGYPDEGVAESAIQWSYDGPVITSRDDQEMQRNGTFVVFRRLEENVAELARWVDRNISPFSAHLANQPRYHDRKPEDVETAAELTAALIGRYPHRVPLVFGENIRWETIEQGKSRTFGARPGDPITSGLDDATSPSADAEGNVIANNWFRYDDNDSVGRQCPLGAHIRRANPRDAMGGAKLTSRHRIIRRSYSYGTLQTNCADVADRGLAFVGVCANIESQFEFVKREWFNSGHSLHTGADVDPVAGDFEDPDRKFVIQDTQSPYVTKLAAKPFVEATYGEYFFAPSMSMLWHVSKGQ